MSRWRRGWMLTKQSWAAVSADRSLIAFPVMSAVAALVTLAVFVGGGAALMSDDSLTIVGIAVIVIGVYLVVVVSVFCGVALSACAARSLQGEDTTVGEGIAAARSRLDVIFA